MAIAPRPAKPSDTKESFSLADLFLSFRLSHDYVLHDLNDEMSFMSYYQRTGGGGRGASPAMATRHFPYDESHQLK